MSNPFDELKRVADASRKHLQDAFGPILPRLEPLDTTGFEEAQAAASWLQQAFESTAEWRGRTAERHPNDARNSEAVALLTNLAAGVDHISMVDLRRYREATMRDDGIPAQETEQEMLRQIGFSYWPETAETFVRDFLAKLDR